MRSGWGGMGRDGEKLEKGREGEQWAFMQNEKNFK